MKGRWCQFVLGVFISFSKVVLLLKSMLVIFLSNNSSSYHLFSCDSFSRTIFPKLGSSMDFIEDYCSYLILAAVSFTASIKMLWMVSKFSQWLPLILVFGLFHESQVCCFLLPVPPGAKIFRFSFWVADLHWIYRPNSSF